jgi:hypothetical protein
LSKISMVLILFFWTTWIVKESIVRGLLETYESWKMKNI